MQKILLVEDDKALSNGISLALKNSELNIVQCYDLKTAKMYLSRDVYDLIILDINLPDGNGLEFLTTLKNESSSPVIMLTANDLETDIVTGLEMGADDYITKPFSLVVLRARVNTQLRKQTFKTFQQDCFIFDFEKITFLKNNLQIELSKTEQRLLRILIENKGITLPRSVLIDRIWTDGSEYVDENALSVTVKRLRDKLEDQPSKPEYIKNVYGIGYIWAVR
ncbi:MAG: response regulator transcription factor [Clostridiales bacterium]|nr:response regulator transcription factor [Clostridiales bacterium]